MRRRLDLAAALVHRPPVLFLDEPTTGLDPRSAADLWQVIEELVTDGTTVLLTTQYLEEADRLADRISVVDHGRVIAEGTAAELKAQLGNTIVARRAGRQQHGSMQPSTCWAASVTPRSHRTALGRGAGRPTGRAVAHRHVRALDAAGIETEPDERPRAEPRRRVPQPHRPPGRDRSRTSTRRSRPMTDDRRTTAAPQPVRRGHTAGIRGALADAITIGWRNLKSMSRSPQVLVFSTIQPMIFVLMFRYVFGGAINGHPRRRLRRLPDAGHLRADGHLRRRSTPASAWPTISARGSSNASARCRWRARRCSPAARWPTSSATCSCSR